MFHGKSAHGFPYCIYAIDALVQNMSCKLVNLYHGPIHRSIEGVATIDAQNVWDCKYKCTRQAGFWGVSGDFSPGVLLVVYNTSTVYEYSYRPIVLSVQY